MGVADVLSYREQGIVVVPLKYAKVSAPRAEGLSVPREGTHPAGVTVEVTVSLLCGRIPDLNKTRLSAHRKVLTLSGTCI